MDGIQYEKYCAKYLSTLGYKNIRLTKASGDQGIDIIANKKNKQYGFQCKYYTKPVGNDAIQQAFSGIAYYNLDKAIVITNQSFTASARQLAKQTHVELWDHIEPLDDGSHYTPYHLLAIVLLGFAMIQLYQIFNGTFLNKDYLSITYSLLFISTLLQAIPHHSKTATSLSLLLACIHLGLYMHALDNPLTFDLQIIATSAFVLLTGIRFAYYQKKYRIRKLITQKNQVRQNIQEIQEQMSANLIDIFANYLDCKVKLVSTIEKGNDLVITLQTNHTRVNLLPDLQQQLNHQQSKVSYQLTPIGLHQIEVNISVRH